MKSNELLAILEQVAPIKLSDDFCKKCSAYDNSGIIVDSGREITGVLFTLELSPKAVAEAIKKGCNAIVTHHPAIYGGIQRLDATQNPQINALCKCVKKDMTVISMHLNFDAAPEGIDNHLMKAVGGTECKTMINLDGGAYGRVYNITTLSLGSLAEKLKRKLDSERVLVYGNKQKNVSIAASFCGAGCDDEAIAFAVQNKADVFISSDIKHHQIAELVARGINVIVLTHYAAEAYGMKKIYQKLESKISVHTSYYTDEELL